ncbi:MAG: hypothetical protein R3E56_03945 [Burkholderiaceae bacterium]
MNAHDLTPFRTAGTLYLSAPEAVELVRRKGLADCLAGMASQIEEFQALARFQQSARVANHSKAA